MPHTIITSRGDQLTRGMARTNQVFRALGSPDLPFHSCCWESTKASTTLNTTSKCLTPTPTQQDTHDLESGGAKGRGNAFSNQTNRIRSPFAAIEERGLRDAMRVTCTWLTYNTTYIHAAHETTHLGKLECVDRSSFMCASPFPPTAFSHAFLLPCLPIRPQARPPPVLIA